VTPARNPVSLYRDSRLDAVSEEAEPVYLTVRETAKRIGISANGLYLAIQRGEAPFARRIGHRIVVPLAALRRWEAGG